MADAVSGQQWWNDGFRDLIHIDLARYPVSTASSRN